MLTQRKGFFIFLSLSLMVVVFLGGSFYHTYDLIHNNEGDLIRVSDFMSNGQAVDFSSRYLSKEGQRSYDFQTIISREAFEKLDDDYYKLILYQISSNGYRVYFNGRLIGAVGDPGAQENYIWNSVNTYDLSKNMIQDKNILEIKIWPTYKKGKSSFPILIATTELGNQITSWIDALFIHGYFILIGGLAFASLFGMLLFLFTKNTEKELLYYALGAFLGTIYLFNYVSMTGTVISILAFKKIVYSSLYLAVIFFSLAINKHLQSKVIKVLRYSLLIGLMAALLFGKDIYLFRKMYGVLNLLTLTNIVVWMGCSIGHLKKNYEVRILFINNGFILFLSLYEIITSYKYNMNFIRFPVFGMTLYAVGVITIILVSYINQQNLAIEKAVEVRKEKELLKKLSITDGMTGLYNHRYFYSYIASKINVGCDEVVIMFADLDRFKTINDGLGHTTGDLILKKTANIIKDRIKGKGVAFRYGGEEFVVVLQKNDAQGALDIAEKIRSDIEESKELKTHAKDLEVSISIGIATYPRDGKNLKEVIDKADQAMYQAKLKGRNRCEIYKAHEKESDTPFELYSI